MIEHAVTGIVLGTSAGLAPGPLSALVISESLRYGMGAGFRTALSPLVTDFPIVLLALLVVKRLASADPVLGGVSMVGALVLARMGMEGFRANLSDLTAVEPGESASLKKGILVNMTSPHPYLFWISVGSPLFFKALDHHVFSAVLFIGCFYLMLVGSKMALAFAVSRSRGMLMTGSAYTWIMRGLGGVLLLFAGLLVRDGLRLLTSG